VQYFALALVLLLTACHREQRSFNTHMPETPQTNVVVSKLFPGNGSEPTPDPHRAEYENNAYHLAEGKRLFESFNCSGCHFHGGGGMGPALMDDQWSYGGELEQIYMSITQGRPNGMPTFGQTIPEQERWELAAYVRSMTGNVPKAAAPSRDDHMQNKPSEARTERQPPAPAGSPPTSLGTSP
jgi:cytochrome c oxidase cbb3-type subunit 3